ncbi:hypothetical protein ACFWGP_05315 [Agromyces sp. NPDC127015]|uniref:hypothetical protein n=1 Tax=Agromyces sp. NPDC127015 TaxID=3347108 RepID=UPI00365142B5
MATLEALARAYANRYKTPGSGEASWDQMCGSLMFRMCDLYGKEPTGDVRSAYIVYERSSIVSTDPSKAQPGDFHFWAIGGRYNGHVGLDVRGGGSTVFMATRAVRESLGSAIGFQSVQGYSNAKGATYLGFSRGYANGDVLNFEVAKPAAPAGSGSGPAWSWMVPSAAVQKRVQAAAKKRNRYFGLVDGKWGKESIKAIQRTIARVGYAGLIDGIPGPMTCYYVQVYAKRFGSYTGPIDKKLGPNSWAGFALGLERP